MMDHTLANICEKFPGTDRSGEARRTESGGGDLGEGIASPFPTIQEVWGGSPAEIEFGAF